mgnify:CR=1 FL=1
MGYFIEFEWQKVFSGNCIIKEIMTHKSVMNSL